MVTEVKSLLAVLCAFLVLAGTVLYSIHHPETGDDIYESQPR